MARSLLDEGFTMMNIASSLPAASGIFFGGLDAHRNDVVLPIELEEALASDVYLPADFERLSHLQRSCYAEWVAEGLSEDVRKERAAAVCSVARVLAS